MVIISNDLGVGGTLTPISLIRNYHITSLNLEPITLDSMLKSHYQLPSKFIFPNVGPIHDIYVKCYT